MKKILLTIAVAALFLFGCQDENSIVGPVQKQVQQTQNNHQWLTFPADQQSSIEQLFYLSKSIDGAYGGGFYFRGNMSREIYVNGKISVPASAYTGTKKIGITLNSESVSADFSPSPTTFNKPVLYSIEYYGVDLSNINPAQIDFYYIDGNGNLVKAKYSSIKVDVKTGFLAVYDAQLPHFSRYGFVN